MRLCNFLAKRPRICLKRWIFHHVYNYSVETNCEPDHKTENSIRINGFLYVNIEGFTTCSRISHFLSKCVVLLHYKSNVFSITERQTF